MIYQVTCLGKVVIGFVDYDAAVDFVLKKYSAHIIGNIIDIKEVEVIF